MKRIPTFLLTLAAAASLRAAVYHVDGNAENASDEGPGSPNAPWRTLARAGSAAELKPGDTVLIHTGVYREHMDIVVSGEAGNPVTFAAAPGARVVIKGSEVVRGPWTRVSADPDRPEPYPNAFTGVWRTELGEEFFTDPRFAGAYTEPGKRWVSQVFVSEQPLQRIGLDPIYRNEEYLQLATVGVDLSDIVQNSFYFDASEQALYIKISGEPGWYGIEVGVRGFTLTVQDRHDVVIRGLELRHNRQPGGQWPMIAISGCERVVMEDCRVAQADFCGLGLGRSKHCTIRRCDLSGNGNTGLGMGECEECVIEDCTLMFNNYRRFHPGWHCGGMKCIPRNLRCTVQRCEAAYNINSDGIWFDADNAEIRIVDNISHHNDGCGIFFEINKGGGLIANNLVYANRGRGIYISGSQKTLVAHNTVAANLSGIVCMPRGEDWPLEDVRVLNNLLLGNTITTPGHARGADLTLFMGTPGDGNGDRTVMSNHSDCNVFSNASEPPALRDSWNPDNSLARWRERFGEDTRSREAPVEFRLTGTGFRLLDTDGLDVAGPLPPTPGWQPPVPQRVGCSRTRWP